MDTTVVVVAAVAVVIVVALVAFYVISSRRRTSQLRGRFGPEYEQAVTEQGSQRRAEAALQSRVDRVEKLSIRPLPTERREEFVQRWDAVQARFVDDPPGAVADAERLVQEVMGSRGYPVGSFEQRAADISVDHPDIVKNYREAHALHVRAQTGDCSTDDLRRGFVYYRELFRELLEPERTGNRSSAGAQTPANRSRTAAP